MSRLLVPPAYGGGSLVDVVTELEGRLTAAGRPEQGLRPELAALIPPARTYVIVLFDGLGAMQLDHPRAADLRRDLRATVDAMFPTTTTVSLASLATGLPPSGHGLLGYQLWLPEVGQVVNTIKWTTLWGDPLPVTTEGFLPAPNTWERLTAAGREPITVQPAGFAGTPLSTALYRGCRFEPVDGIDEAVEATIQLAGEPGRLILTYLPQVDFAAHVHGQASREYGAAMGAVAMAWSRLRRAVPRGAALVGTADHGHVDIPQHRRHRLAKDLQADRILYGDARVTFVLGDPIDDDEIPATWKPFADMSSWWGPPPWHEAFDERRPSGALIADRGHAVLHRFSDARLVGHHGGLTEAERTVPLLIAGG